jgi:transposase
MEAAVLEAYLRHGLSLERIAALTGRHPSTVGYWVKQHGLSAVHRDRHAPKGGVDRDTLVALVAEGLSTRQVSERLGLSQSTVRHWLRNYGLRTHRARRENSRGVRGVNPDRKLMECARHGLTVLARAQGHVPLPPMSLGSRVAVVRREAAKCILLCANCHSEVEAGIVKVA